MTIVTVIVFTLMIKILTGQIGHCETWRIVASITGFVGILIIDFVLVYHLGRNSVTEA